MRADAIMSGENELTLDAVLKVVRAECRILYEDEFSKEEGDRFHLV